MFATVSLVNVCDLTQLQFIFFDEHRSPDIITTLLIGSTPIQNVFGVLKKKVSLKQLTNIGCC